MTTVYTTSSAKETQDLGEKIVQTLMGGTLICLSGDLGAGKTTFTQGLLQGAGASRPYVSPTFVIMKQYDLSSSTDTGVTRIYHADAYRVEEKDFLELGFSEWCGDEKGIVILEWPERIQSLLPKERIDITLRSLSENEREIVVEKK